VLAVLDDKDAVGILRPVLPLLDRAVFTSGQGGRYLPPATLASLAGQLRPELDTDVIREPTGAVALARALAGEGGAVIVTGSLRLLSDLARAPTTRASCL